MNSAQRNFQHALKQHREIQAKRESEPLDSQLEHTPAIPGRDRNSSSSDGAVAEPSDTTEIAIPDEATEPLNAESVSLRIPAPLALVPPIAAAPVRPEKKNNPPIAA
jgi:hypothetical protein